jgi:hypothetical protein
MARFELNSGVLITVACVLEFEFQLIKMVKIISVCAGLEKNAGFAVLTNISGFLTERFLAGKKCSKKPVP